LYSNITIQIYVFRIVVELPIDVLSMDYYLHQIMVGMKHIYLDSDIRIQLVRSKYDLYLPGNYSVKVNGNEWTSNKKYVAENTGHTVYGTYDWNKFTVPRFSDLIYNLTVSMYDPVTKQDLSSKIRTAKLEIGSNTVLFKMNHKLDKIVFDELTEKNPIQLCCLQYHEVILSFDVRGEFINMNPYVRIEWDYKNLPQKEVEKKKQSEFDWMGHYVVKDGMCVIKD